MIKKGIGRSSWDSYFCVNSNIVTKVSEDLMRMIQYTEEELLGRTFDCFCSLLKMNHPIDLGNLELKRTGYIFTRDLEPREVAIYHDGSGYQDDEKYFVKEIPNSRIKRNFLFTEALLKDNKLGANILSYPELILLNTNQKFLDLLNSPYNEKHFAVGQSLNNIVPSGYSDKIEKIIEEAVGMNQSCFLEMMEFTSDQGENKYYNAAYVPIFTNGKAKYIVNTVTEVTEQVNAKKMIEDKNKLLKTIIENISDAVLIFDQKGNPVVLNKNITQEFPEESLNKIEDLRKYHRYYDEVGEEIAPENIPIKRALRGERINKGIMTVDTGDGKSTVQYNTIPIYDSNHDIVAGAVFINDITNLSMLEESSAKDFLTGLNNARSYDCYYKNCIKTSLEKNERFSILMVDIDHFKRINDTYGHSAGNIVLREFSAIIAASCRDFDFVSRLGGEEFSVILQQCSLDKTMEVAERIRKKVENFDFVINNDTTVHITVSIGIAVYPDTVDNVNEVMENADMALYKAKRSGRNRVSF